MSNGMRALKIETDGKVTEVMLSGTDPLASVHKELSELCGSAARVVCRPFDEDRATDFDMWMDEDAPARGGVRNRVAWVVLSASQPDRVCTPVGTVILTGTAGRGARIADLHEDIAQMVTGALIFTGQLTP